MQTRTVRRLSAWVLFSIAVIAVIGWQLTRDALPETVRIATAEELGVYHAFAETFSGLLGKRTSCSA